MRIALDYDKTYTLDPEFWDRVITIARHHGHDVRMVTARNEHFDMTSDLFAISRRMVVHWCRGVAKGWWLSHFGGGWKPDVVIDDKPEAWIENSPFPPDKLAEWRSTRGEGQHYGSTEDAR